MAAPHAGLLGPPRRAAPRRARGPRLARPRPFLRNGDDLARVCRARGRVRHDGHQPVPRLARAGQTRRYSSAEIASFVASARKVERAIACARGASWTPAIHKIERWWSSPSLAALGRGRAAILRARETVEQPVADMLDVTFCRAMIESANVSFGHQSMSFRKGEHLPSNAADVAARFSRAASAIATAASSPVLRPPGAPHRRPRPLAAPARVVRLRHHVTSVPEPNELRARAAPVHVLARLPGRLAGRG